MAQRIPSILLRRCGVTVFHERFIAITWTVLNHCLRVTYLQRPCIPTLLGASICSVQMPYRAFCSRGACSTSSVRQSWKMGGIAIHRAILLGVAALVGIRGGGGG